MLSIFDIVIKQLSEELSLQIKAQNDEIETSKHFKGAMESRYDTFKEEAQEKCIVLGKRIKELETSIAMCHRIKDGAAPNLFKLFSLSGPRDLKVILAPVSARDFQDIKIISPEAPMGKALLRANEGDEIRIGPNIFTVQEIKSEVGNQNGTDFNLLTDTIKEMNLKYLRLTITKQCPAACPACHHEGFYNNTSNHNLSLSEYKNIALLFKPLFERVKLTGGEPLASPHVYDIAHVFKEMGYTVSITTNGFLLNDNRIARLKDSGVVDITVSFPSLNPTTYMQWFGIKNPSVQVHVLENIKKLSVFFERVKLNMVIENEQQFLSEMDSFIKLAKGYNVELNPFMVHSDKSKEKELHNTIVKAYNLQPVSRNSKTAEYQTLDGVKITLSHELYDNAAHTKNNSICKSCPNNKVCIEGAYALRIDETGDIKTCLANPVFGNIRNIIQRSK